AQLVTHLGEEVALGPATLEGLVARDGEVLVGLLELASALTDTAVELVIEIAQVLVQFADLYFCSFALGDVADDAGVEPAVRRRHVADRQFQREDAAVLA